LHIKYFIGMKFILFKNITHRWMADFVFCSNFSSRCIRVLIKLCKIVALFSSLEADVGHPLCERSFMLLVLMKRWTVLTTQFWNWLSHIKSCIEKITCFLIFFYLHTFSLLRDMFFFRQHSNRMKILQKLEEIRVFLTWGPSCQKSEAI